MITNKNKRNMKSQAFIKYLSCAAIITFAAMFNASCSNEEDAIIPTESNTHKLSCIMTLHADKPSYNDEGNATRAVTSNWDDGSTIYIQFANGNSPIMGMATYSSNTGLWEVAYETELPKTQSGTCKMYFFDNADDINIKGASIGGTTGIYEDTNAMFAYDGEKLSVAGKLIPKLGRVRFSGNLNDTIMLSGVKRYGYFNATDCTYKLDSTEVLLSATVKEGDKYYTPYYYGAMIEGNKALEITDMKDAFKRYCSDVFKAGESGYMKIPHAESFSGWMKNDPLAQSKVSINWPDSISEDRRAVIMNLIETMIPVEGGSFWMGAQSYDSKEKNYNVRAHTDEYPVHQTVVSPFYLSRTEVTQKQWKAVMGYNAPVVDGDNYPVRYFRKNWSNSIKDEYLSFVNKLNFITGLEFSLPTEAEWEYASFGGKNGSYKFWAGTQKFNSSYCIYTYSSPYCGVVGTKLPNELGLYDMSGNVAELCYSIGNYTDRQVINPRWDNSSYSYRGGSSSDLYYDYNYNYTYYSLTNRTSYSSSSSWNYSLVGIRLCLRLVSYR